MKIICTKCKEEKDSEEFSKNSSKKLGHNSICKYCHSDYRSKYYKDNRDRELKQVKQYQILNPDRKINKKSNNYSKKAGRTIRSNCKVCNNIVFLTSKEDNELLKRCCSKECRKTLLKSSYHYYLKGVEKRAKKTGKEFDLTELFLKHLLEVDQNNLCALTSIPIEINNQGSVLYKTASLDRIDNSKGYTKDNVRWVVIGVNYMKIDYSEEETHKLLTLIKENYISLV